MTNGPNAPLQAGDRVRVLRLGRFSANFQRLVRNRIGTVQSVGAAIGIDSLLVKVQFDPRRAGGPQPVETFYPSDLERVP